MRQLLLTEIVQKEAYDTNSGNRCFKCGRTDRKLLFHHISYFPEKMVMCCWPCHHKIHTRLRKQNQCKWSVADVYKMSKASYAKDRQFITFYESMMLNVRFHEQIIYARTGNVVYTDCFEARNGKKLWYEDIQ